MQMRWAGSCEADLWVGPLRHAGAREPLLLSTVIRQCGLTFPGPFAQGGGVGTELGGGDALSVGRQGLEQASDRLCRQG